MFSFQTPEEEEKFTIEFIQSPYWQFMKDMLEGRMETIFRQMEATPSISPDARAQMHGRLIELRWIMAVPLGAAEFYKNKQNILNQSDSLYSADAMKTLFPDIVIN